MRGFLHPLHHTSLSTCRNTQWTDSKKNQVKNICDNADEHYCSIVLEDLLQHTNNYYVLNKNLFLRINISLYVGRPGRQS